MKIRSIASGSCLRIRQELHFPVDISDLHHFSDAIHSQGS